jgi:hypothetical protein
MSWYLTSIRLPRDLVAELKALAQRETTRTGETVTWARLLRDAARRTVEQAKAQRPPAGV